MRLDQCWRPCLRSACHLSRSYRAIYYLVITSVVLNNTICTLYQMLSFLDEKNVKDFLWSLGEEIQSPQQFYHDFFSVSERRVRHFFGPNSVTFGYNTNVTSRATEDQLETNC